MTLKEAEENALLPLLNLYTHLHENPLPELDDALRALWSGIVRDPNHHVVVGMQGDCAVCSCVVVIVPNLTHGQRPYAVVENVVTHPAHRGKGYATQALAFARQLAADSGCYKIMLMTGAKDAATLRFYSRAGYNKEDKTAFIQWLE